jgi:hypothetical protein
MVARVASFAGVDVEIAQTRMADVEAVIRPLVERLPGYRGTLAMTSEDGKQLTITFFDTADNAAAAEPTFDEELPRALGELFEDWGGHRVSVDTYTVLVDMRG